VRRKGLLHPAALGPGLVLLLGLIPFTGFAAFLALYGKEVGIDDVGPVFVVYAGLVLIIRITAARLPDRLGWRAASTGALLAVGTAGALLGLWASAVAVYVAAVAMAMGMSLLFPALFSAVINGTPEAERSQAVGTFSLFFDLSQGLGAPLLGLVVALSDSYRAAFLVSSFAALGGFAAQRALHLRSTAIDLEPSSVSH
jgi:MFS family permease